MVDPYRLVISYNASIHIVKMYLHQIMQTIFFSFWGCSAQIFSVTVTDIISYCFCSSLILPMGLKSTLMFCYLFIVTQVYLEEKWSNHMICKQLQHDDHFYLVQGFPNFGPRSHFIRAEDAKPFCQWWKNNMFTKNSLMAEKNSIWRNVTYPETITWRKTPGTRHVLQ